jgi:hypothetical protein
MYIYVAGPYRNHPGGYVEAVRDMCVVSDKLYEMGHIPFNPLLNHYWEQLTMPTEGMTPEEEHRHWMEWDLAWLRVCDGILRLPGHSAGADEEVEVAKELGLAVYYGLHEIPNLANQGVP